MKKLLLLLLFLAPSVAKAMAVSRLRVSQSSLTTADRPASVSGEALAKTEARGEDVKGTSMRTMNEQEEDLYNGCRSGELSLIQIALEQGADIQSTTHALKMTPLHLAAWYGNSDIVEFLIRQEAFINAKDCDGDTPLHRAAAQGHTATVALLLARGADARLANNTGLTAYDRAIRRGHTAIAELIAAKQRGGGSQKLILQMQHQNHLQARNRLS